MTRACRLVPDLLRDAAERVPDAIAITAGGTATSYAALARAASAVAAALAEAGVGRGDRVVVCGENGTDVVIAYWAALLAGAIPVVMHPQTRPARLAFVIADCAARAVLAEPAIASRVARPTAQVVELGGTWWRDAARSGAPAPPRRAIDADLAAIVYTSGSTGQPKGAMFAHRNVLAATASIGEYLEIRASDVIASALPLAFSYGLYQLLMAAAAGARVVLERSFAYPSEVLARIAAERVTGLPGVPAMFATLLRLASGRSFELSSIRYVTTAAAAMPVTQLRALQELLPGAQIFSMYGQTECVRCSYLPPAELARRPASIGIAIPNSELWLVDEAGRRLGPGHTGELVVRGACLMRGYWNQPEATARKLRPGPVPGERVLHTGDLCRLDDDGYLYFVARLDDMIMSGGEKVPPRAVEDALLEISGIREAAVVGVPHERLGQAVRAVVVLEPGAPLDVAAIQRECRARLEPAMVPQEIVVRDALPRNPNGKVQKSELT